ncbi:nSTAND1 domain-containing NTPase [Nocardia sp. NPDC055029]
MSPCAEEAYAKLSDKQRDEARRVFVRLAAPGDPGRVYAERVPRSDLFADVDECQLADNSTVVEAFAE